MKTQEKLKKDDVVVVKDSGMIGLVCFESFPECYSILLDGHQEKGKISWEFSMNLKSSELLKIGVL